MSLPNVAPSGAWFDYSHSGMDVAVERVLASPYYFVTVYAGENARHANHVVDDFGTLVAVESWS